MIDNWIAIWNKAKGNANASCFVTIEMRLRSYWNSEGVTQTTETIWCDLAVRLNTSLGTTAISDGVYGIEGVGSAIESCVQEVQSRTQDSLIPVCNNNRNQKETLVLAPTVSAVLLHELIGHGVEERNEADSYPLLVGPDNMNIIAVHPRRNGFDDEGIPIKEVKLVQNGWLSSGVSGRERVTIYGGYPSGLAQVCTHGTVPLQRCSYLAVLGGNIPSNGLRKDIVHGIYCCGTSGAEFHDGFVYINVNFAKVIDSGELGESVAPFGFMLALADFHRHLVCLADDVTLGRSARCVKYSDGIATVNRAPTTLLLDVPIS